MQKGLTYEVYFKDIPVFEIKSSGEVNIYEEKYMPIEIYLEESFDIDDLANNIVNFNSWSAERIIPLDRKYAKEILAYYGYDNSLTLSERANIGIATRCLSINDCFWVKQKDEDITWSEINLYDNSLENSVFEIPLLGKGFTADRIEILTPDIHTDGKAPKAWKRTKDGFYLLKRDCSNESALREVEASKILQKLGLDVIDYNLDIFNDTQVSICKCFTDKNTHMAKADYYSIYLMNKDLDFGVDLQTIYKEALNKMVLADYLVGNIDRHARNWGVIYDSEMNVKSLSPIYDFDHAFEAEGSEICQPYHFIGRHVLLADAAREILQSNAVVLNTDADLSEFKYGGYVRDRLNNIWLDNNGN